MDKLYSQLEAIRAQCQIFHEFNTNIDTNQLCILKEQKIIIDLKDLTNEDMKMSGYGNFVKKQTEYNKEVRDSIELDANCVYFKNNKNDFTDYININNSDLIKNLQEKISELHSNTTIEPYKLIKYEKGSFFKKHVDSLKDTNNIGTILVCLSDDYQGGTFVLYNKNNKYEFNLKKNDALFFYGSCPHEVLPITDGHRYVLTFDVYSNSTFNLKNNEINLSLSEQFDNFFKNVVAYTNNKKLNNNNIQYVCIELEHKYASNDFPNEDCSNIEYSYKDLKGSDKLMYEHLSSKIKDVDSFFKNKSLCFIENILRIKNVVVREHNGYCSVYSRVDVPKSSQLNSTSKYILDFYEYKVNYDKYKCGSYRDNICNECYNNENYEYSKKSSSHCDVGDDSYSCNYNYSSKESNSNMLFLTDYNKWTFKHKLNKEYFNDNSDNDNSDSEDSKDSEDSDAYYIGNQHCSEYYSYGKVFLILTKEHLEKMFSV